MLGPTGFELRDATGRTPTIGSDEDANLFGTLNNMEATDWEQSEVGWGLSFDGVDEYVAHPVSTRVPSSFMILAQAPTGVTNAVWSLSDGGETNKQTLLRFAGGAGGGIEFRKRNTLFQTTGSLISYVADRWYAIVGLDHSPTLRECYVDGVFNGNSTANVPDISTINHVDIGRAGDSSPNYGECKIAYSALWNRVLTPNEIYKLHVDPMAPFRFKSRFIPLEEPVVADGVAPTSHIHGPLFGPFGGPV